MFSLTFIFNPSADGKTQSLSSHASTYQMHVVCQSIFVILLLLLLLRLVEFYMPFDYRLLCLPPSLSASLVSFLISFIFLICSFLLTSRLVRPRVPCVVGFRFLFTHRDELVASLRSFDAAPFTLQRLAEVLQVNRSRRWRRFAL